MTTRPTGGLQVVYIDSITVIIERGELYKKSKICK